MNTKTTNTRKEKTKNDLIVEKIKLVRIERAFTQKDLADHLKKTPAAISDLERGKVQVTAEDLYTISDFLNKPIEYFYGEEFTGSEVQDLISIIRKMPTEIRNDMIPSVKSMLKMQELGDRIKKTDDENQLKELAQEFYQVMIPYVSNMNKFASQSKDLQDKLASVLEITKP